ncbi:DoxX family protein [Tuwongella immobilis]|uniref:DoxX family protein n=1 Tax=Tuwongella immobilis TaxID=692036 RepID=A0A6C2YRJ8_9BACT|nr:DoxX family protein [Tuwongella immobilis]VIP03502.1 Uncharacterized protein OS=Singulisphaera acidiphila (strain ATCC BAA-1392 / DSM 18658 / VKM B-2454 / MOB10) GN=Sinac_6294 PE=4 SV=1: DoxX_2 [Tuwongella immobilis]VTS04372.1 Uncharacterized protein OS=Singulisphaera acidiphila (strain ATCC BAA-1392 / DSM 18658 / VKM B-2454 / MOB10) GN=Sinac_6294 PE=4 SV=1: DoxX_2 [Tuwongella immobilis]
MRATRIAGWVMHVPVAGLMIMAGTFKLLGMIPPEEMAKMQESGMAEKITTIAIGEIIAALLLLLPRTLPLGALVTSGFWGGVICTHWTKNEPIAVWCVFLTLTWIGAFLRSPGMFASMWGKPSATSSAS